jgi:hypothetical protein
MGLFLMVLGFMWWWPLGLIILAALIANERIGYRRRLQFAGSGPIGDWDHVTRMARIGEKADRVPAKADGLRDRVRGNWWGQPSSGNRAFDDYRAETLRRLEDEQRVFKEFLKRLRVARDRAEFDQFMNVRHLDAPFASSGHCDATKPITASNQGANGDLECIASCRGSDANHHKVMNHHKL